MKITIQNQKNILNSIEKVELSNGNYLSNCDIDLLIQQISAFGQENGIDISNSQNVKQNTQLMTIITNSWKVA